MSGNTDVKKLIAESLNEVADYLESGKVGQRIRVGVTLLGSEHGTDEVLKGAEKAQADMEGAEVIVIGPACVETSLAKIVAEDENDCHAKMDKALENGDLHAAVTMHYNFPIGVSTVGCVVTPGHGKEMFLATTTGTTATERVAGMVKNAIYGIAVAKACGRKKPTVGVLNVDGARQVERALRELQTSGYELFFAESARADGGVVMRGNDLLAGMPDIMVNDTLTGNLLMKIFSAYTTGGSYESLGQGYGPGVGEGYKKIINIISRASGAPVIAGALKYAAQVARNKVTMLVDDELAKAKKAGLDGILAAMSNSKSAATEAAAEVKMPEKKPVCEQIAGIDVLELEDAQKALWSVGIYAETGMGCTGPIVLVAAEDMEKATEHLRCIKVI